MSFFFYVVNVGEDCPVFDGLFEFCQLSTGGSIGKKTSSSRFISLIDRFFKVR